MTTYNTPGYKQIFHSDSKSAEDKFTDKTVLSDDDNARQYGIIAVQVEEDDTPYSDLSGATVTPETGKAYYYPLPSAGGTIVLPTIPAKFENKLHTVLIQFDTLASASVAIQAPAGTALNVSGATPVLGKHYTASCMYRKVRASAQATPTYKWVVTITEDVV